MRLSDESVAKFISVYKKAYGVELAVGEARTMATNLVTVYRLILRRLPEKKSEDLVGKTSGRRSGHEAV